MSSSTDLDAIIQRTRPRFRTASAFVEAALRDAIVSNALPGGTPLRQEELARRFGVSRMPVREAIRQLEAQALVDFHPHRGAVVCEISASDAADNYAIRAALEPAALRLSIPHLSDDDVHRARDLISEMDAEEDDGRMGDLNRRFHMTLYGKAGRPKLLALIQQQLDVADRYLRFHLAALGPEHLSQHEHRALIGSCARRDVAESCRILERHIETADRALQAFLASRSNTEIARNT